MKKPLLTRPRSQANLVVCQAQLYLIGGRTQYADATPPSNVASLDTIEVLADNGTWRQVGKLRTARHDAGCTAVGK